MINTGLSPRSDRGAEESGWLRFFGGFEPGENNFIAVHGRGVFGNDVEQQARQPCIGEMCGDARAHRAGAKDNSLLNRTDHDQALKNEDRTAEQVTKWDATGQTGVW